LVKPDLLRTSPNQLATKVSSNVPARPATELSRHTGQLTLLPPLSHPRMLGAVIHRSERQRTEAATFELADARSTNLRAIQPVSGLTALMSERDDERLAFDQDVDEEKR